MSPPAREEPTEHKKPPASPREAGECAVEQRQGRVRGFTARRHAAAGRPRAHVPVDGMTGGTGGFLHCNPGRAARIFPAWLPQATVTKEAVMYSLQHVFWRGAMALSLLVLGGIGAGVSDPPREAVQACPGLQDAVRNADVVRAAARREVAMLQRAQARERQVREGA